MHGRADALRIAHMLRVRGGAARYDRRRRRLAADGIYLGVDVTIAPTAIVARRLGGEIRLDDRVHVDDGAKIYSQGGGVHLGHDVYVGPNAILYGAGGLVIGADSLIAGNTMIVPGNHVFADPDIPIRQQGGTRRGVTVGRDVWVAGNVTVLDGVTIDDHAIVAAGAVVSRDVAPFAIVGGVPAKVIGWRKPPPG